MSLTWVMPVNEEERILSLSIWKGNYTYEFALCITTSEMLKKVNKFEALGLELEKGIKIKTPHIKNCAGF